MRRFIMTAAALALLVTACAPPTPAQPPSIIIEEPTHGSTDMTPAQIAALTHLSEALNLSADQITLVSTESVTWPDGCLGVERPGVMCTQALVEGYRILFEAGGREYEVRTNESGSALVIVGGLEISSMIETVLIQQLVENLGLDEADISVVSNEPVEFADACLGVMMQEVTCAEVITPGRIVVLEADSVQYEYHVSDDGMHIQPATLALTWARDGGIAGFCDRLTVFLSGEVYGSRCAGQPDGTMGIFSDLLTSEQREQFDDWARQYGELSMDASDPKNVSDRMTITLEFFGTGTRTSATASDSQELLEFAQSLYQELYK